MNLLRINPNKLRSLATTYTQARVGLNRSGVSLSTSEILKFNLDHALARDAIHKTWNYHLLKEKCISENWFVTELKTKIIDREKYILNPPDGCILDDTSVECLELNSKEQKDICLIVSDGLSATALEDHAFEFLKCFMPYLNQLELKTYPIFIVPFSRVGISDHIGQILKAKFSIILIGERPGLSAHNSMGIYTTINPKIGCTNADRKCISNIRPPFGLDYEDVAKQLYMQMKSLL